MSILLIFRFLVNYAEFHASARCSRYIPRYADLYDVPSYAYQHFMDTRTDSSICEIRISGEIGKWSHVIEMASQMLYNSKTEVFGLFLLFKNPQYLKVIILSISLS